MALVRAYISLSEFKILSPVNPARVRGGTSVRTDDKMAALRNTAVLPSLALQVRLRELHTL